MAGMLPQHLKALGELVSPASVFSIAKFYACVDVGPRKGG